MSSDRLQLSFRNTDVTTLEWLWVHFLMLLPVLNVLALLRWAFSSRVKASLQNFARSVLVALLVATTVVGALLGSGALEEDRFRAWGEAARRGAATFIASEGEPFSDQTPAYRTFTDTNGRSMQGVVNGFKGSKAIIERVDGRVFETDVARFSEPDRTYLMELRRQMDGRR